MIAKILPLDCIENVPFKPSKRRKIQLKSRVKSLIQLSEFGLIRSIEKNHFALQPIDSAYIRMALLSQLKMLSGIVVKSDTKYPMSKKHQFPKANAHC